MHGKITIGHVYNMSNNSIRVDRQSPLGNPFILRNAKDSKQRDVVCDQYETYLWKACKDEPEVRKELIRIYRLVRDGNDVELCCWCAPRRCHAESIKQFIETMLKRGSK